jgi:RNase adaptor protein for sRNA GlmZ degradation
VLKCRFASHVRKKSCVATKPLVAHHYSTTAVVVEIGCTGSQQRFLMASQQLYSGVRVRLTVSP